MLKSLIFCNITIMIKTVINTKNLDEADIVILSTPYEKTASSGKGTVNGPKAIIDCLDYKLEFFDRELKFNVNDYVKTAHLNLKSIRKFNPEKVVEKIKAEYSKILEKGKFPIILGGEHTVSLGALKSISERIDPKEITILQIDAHCDLRNDDNDYPSKKNTNLAHSCVMRRASELGYKIVQVGIRTYFDEEYKYFSNPENNITVFEWGYDKKYSIEEILKMLKTKYVYLSIDVDGFDPAYMPGTGTPVQGGLEWWFGLELIQKAVNHRELIGADIVEVSPIKDSVLTEYGAAQIVYSIIAQKFQNRK